MSRTASAPSPPSPHRERASIPLLLAGLAAGPAGWALQLEAGYGLSSFACFPHNAPLRQAPPPGWAFEPALLLALNLACVAVCLGGVLVSAVLWRRTHGEKPGSVHSLLRAGEGRTRFLAACGVLGGLGFALAALFDTVPILATPACWSIAP